MERGKKREANKKKGQLTSKGGEAHTGERKSALTNVTKTMLLPVLDSWIED